MYCCVTLYTPSTNYRMLYMCVCVCVCVSFLSTLNFIYFIRKVKQYIYIYDKLWLV